MSAGSVSISGSKKLIISKSKGGVISLEGDLYNEASVVYENGSCRELFAPFTDDVPDLGELLAIQSQINLNKFNPTMDLIAAASGNEAILCGVNQENSQNGKLPTFDVNGKFDKGDRVNVILNGQEFPATVKLKSDGSVYAEVDNYSGLIDSGIEAGEKSKPSMKLMGMAVLDSASTGIIDSLKCAPTFARWFGEKTGLGDENSYKANTEEIERLQELQEGIHNILKENSGDEGTFELMTQTIQYASMVAAVGEIGFCVVANTPRIGKSIIKNGKKIKELLGDSKKITNKIEGLVDDLGGWFKKFKDKDAIEGGSKTKGGSNSKDFYRKNPSDPIRDILGSGLESNPKEWNKLINEMVDNGVEIVYRDGTMAYSPGLVPGTPGQLIIDKNASMSALIHEYQHYLDDVASGLPGMRQLYEQNPRIIKELRAYMKEIKIADELGLKDVSAQLWENYRQEREYILNIFKE